MPVKQPWRICLRNHTNLQTIRYILPKHKKTKQTRVHTSRDVLQQNPPCYTRMTLQWRHNERDGVSNHQPHDCSLKRVFRGRSKKTSSFASLVFVRGIHRWSVNSPHKRPVTRKMLSFDDVIMSWQRSVCHGWLVSAIKSLFWMLTCGVLWHSHNETSWVPYIRKLPTAR